MILFKKASQLAEYLQRSRSNNSKVGFVPTMGALHKGHLSLLETCKEQNAVTTCSIFVNPTQFNDPKDFQRYPVTLEKDLELLAKSGTDVVFVPAQSEIYTNGVRHLQHYDLGDLDQAFEGKYRPGHFQGVCQVMHRLLDIVQPDNLYMGQKDYQQCMVVKRLIKSIGSPATLHTCATLREPDGLAMSSRNMRLNETERRKATAIFQSLSYIKKTLRPGPLQDLFFQAEQILEGNCFKTDYVAIADASSLQPVDEWNGSQRLIALVAAFMNEVRLIDNMLLNPAESIPPILPRT